MQPNRKASCPNQGLGAFLIKRTEVIEMIDVYLFSGFLGSGKTSLLLNVIKQLKEAGKKPAVFMNEFGNLPVDSNSS